jgi:glucose-1-phosphate thymidylyltransferase
MTERAVVLARGLGTRMRQEAPGAQLDAKQAAAADEGMKAFIPIGRPFLDYILSALADAGLTRVCVVIGPEHGVVRRYYSSDVALERITVDFVVQAEPRGTADAVLAAEAWSEGDPFLVVNGDNYYPVRALKALAAISLPGLVAFSREGLLADGQIAPERILRFALLDIDDFRLRRIVEKPDQVDVCRRVPLSPRGELELPMAIQHAIDDGRFPVEAVLSDQGVLDLSGRADIAAVAARLAGVDVRL